MLAITLQILPDLSAAIVNEGHEAIALDGYYLESPSGKLSPNEWRSIADWTNADATAVSAALGPGAVSFGEVAATATDLAEVNLASSGVWLSGTSVDIGRPLSGLQSDVPTNIRFSYRRAETGAVQEQGTVELVAGPSTPSVSISSSASAPLPNPLDAAQITFSEPVSGFGLEDLVVIHDGKTTTLTKTATLSTSDNKTYVLTGLAAAQSQGGDYRLELRAIGSQIVDTEGFTLVQGASSDWQLLGPLAVAIDPIDSPRSTAVDSLQLSFSAPVTGFDLADLSLTLNGGPNLLAGAEQLSTEDHQSWTLSGLAGLTGAGDGIYRLQIKGAGAGIRDDLGRALQADAEIQWSLDTIELTAAILAVDPNLGHLDSVQIVFSEPVNGFNLGDLSLQWSDGHRWTALTRSGATLAQIDATTWEVASLPVPTGEADVTLTLQANSVTDMGGNPLRVGASLTWREDHWGPGVNFAPASPWYEPNPVDSFLVIFTEPVTGLERTDIVVRDPPFGPNLLSGAQTLTQVDAVTWRLDHVGAATKADGFYEIDIVNLRGAIKDLAGNPLANTNHFYWSVIHAPFGAEITNLQPASGATNIESLDVRFNRAPARGFGPEDLRLTRDGGPNLLTGAETLEQLDVKNWHFSGLSSLTQLPGLYTFTVVAAGSNIEDGFYVPFLTDATKSWSVGPVATIDPLHLAEQADPLDGVAIEFSNAVQGFDLADLSLSRNGGPNLLTPSQRLITIDNQRWWLGGLADLTADDGVYELMLTAAGSGVTTLSGVPLAADTSLSLTIKRQGPRVTHIEPVRSADWASPTGLTIEFSDLIYGAPLPGLALRRDGGPNLLDASTKLSITGNMLTLSGLGAKLAVPGNYHFLLSASSSEIFSGRHNPIVADADFDWQTEPTFVLRVEPDGTTDLVNRLSQPLLVDGYFMESSSNRLDTSSWRSIADWVAADPAEAAAALGSGALSFGEVNSGPSSLGELTLGSGGQWQPGQAISLGRPFDGSATDIPAQSSFAFHVAGITTSLYGSFEIVVPAGGPSVMIEAVTPDPTKEAVEGMNIDFSAAVVGFDLADVRLTANGTEIPWTNQSLTSSGGMHWRLAGLTALTQSVASYEVSIPAFGSQITDGQGRPLVGDAVESWRTDTKVPTAVWSGVGAAESRPIDALQIEFSEPVEGFDLADLELSRDGGPNLLSPGQSLVTRDHQHWVLTGLAPLTMAEGHFSARFRPNSGVRDELGNELDENASLEFAIDRTAPTVDIVDVTPDPGPRAKRIEVRFNEPVTGLTARDFAVTNDSGKASTLGHAVLTTTDHQTWVLTNLTDLPFRFSGKLELQLSPGGRIRDLAGNTLVEGASDDWQQDVSPPTGSSQQPPDWTGQRPVPWLSITFSEPVSGLDFSDLVLRRDGVEVPLTNDQVLVPVSPTVWQFDNLAELTMPPGYYQFSFRSQHGITDLIGNDLGEFYGVSWSRDLTEPEAHIVSVSPDPHAGPVESIDFTLSDETIYYSAEISNLSLTRNGGPNLLDNTCWIEMTGWAPYSFRLHLPSGLTSQPGAYRLTIGGPDKDIRSWAGIRMDTPAVEQWSVGFAAQLGAIGRSPRNEAVDSLTIEFSEPVQGFELGDLALIRDGGENLLTQAQTLSTTDGRVWTLGHLAGLTAVSGEYALVLTAANSGIETKAGIALAAGIQEAWTADFAAPTATIQEVSPSVRTSLDRIAFELSERLPGFGLANIAIRRNGQLIDLFGSKASLYSVDQRHWMLTFGQPLTQEGNYELTLIDYGLVDAAGNRLQRASRTWTLSSDPSQYDADFDGSGAVDLADFVLLKSHFGSNATKADGDADGDGDVDLFDFGILKAQFGAPNAADRIFADLGQ